MRNTAGRSAPTYRSRTLAVVVAVVAVALGTLVALRPAATTANWADGESAQAEFTAIVVPEPTGLTCSVDNGVLGLLFSSVTISWHDEGAQYGYEIGASKQEGGPYTVVAGAAIADVGGGRLSTTLKKDVLDNLLTGLLGDTSYYSVRTLLPTPSGHWSSQWASGVGLTSPLLGGVLGAATCAPVA